MRLPFLSRNHFQITTGVLLFCREKNALNSTTVDITFSDSEVPYTVDIPRRRVHLNLTECLLYDLRPVTSAPQTRMHACVHNRVVAHFQTFRSKEKLCARRAAGYGCKLHDEVGMERSY